jgi:hypothetical protein
MKLKKTTAHDTHTRNVKHLVLTCLCWYHNFGANTSPKVTELVS